MLSLALRMAGAGRKERMQRWLECHALVERVAKLKAMLTQLSDSIVADLDKPEITVTYDITDEMKKLLLKKQEEMGVPEK